MSCDAFLRDRTGRSLDCKERDPLLITRSAPLSHTALLVGTRYSTSPAAGAVLVFEESQSISINEQNPLLNYTALPLSPPKARLKVKSRYC
jgi:hypothetical protein